MISRNLFNYINIISKGSIEPLDDVLGESDDDLIYKIFLSFKDSAKTTVSNKFIKKLINRVKLEFPTAQAKLERNMYDLKTNLNQNRVFTLEYHVGRLKDRFKEEN